MTDIEFVRDHVENALLAYREYSKIDDFYVADLDDLHSLCQQLGDALVALAEHNRMDDVYIYGRK